MVNRLKVIVKRIFDIAVASTALLVLLPVMGLTAIAVRIFLGSPVLFTQSRPGLDGKLFRMYKFRTMRDARDDSGKLLPNSQRTTKLGQVLRKLSLDELPELWNVLRGDMSLVGPRPLLPEYLPYYTERERLRHSVRPGLTGLAQVNGRNHLGWDERLELDAQYAESHTLWLDLTIVLITVYKVLFSRDVALGAMIPFHEYRERVTQAETDSRPSSPVAEKSS
jgi:lipopolysaccharide/colanic/teichoic acid biosynthesis glycosyltransferase